jgi:hypothetical protein
MTQLQSTGGDGIHKSTNRRNGLKLIAILPCPAFPVQSGVNDAQSKIISIGQPKITKTALKNKASDDGSAWHCRAARKHQVWRTLGQSENFRVNDQNLYRSGSKSY